MKSTSYTIARSDTGGVLPYAVVTVFQPDGTTKASLFNDAGAGISNPVTADQNGAVGFAAANGTYILRAVSADGAYSVPDIKVQIFDLDALATSIAALGVGSVVGAKYANKAAMLADLAKADGTIALVYADSTALNNDLYYKIGASGAGSWSGSLGLMAGLAQQFALLSADSAAEAENARLQAEAEAAEAAAAADRAHDVVQTASGVYATTALGLAATTDGQFFQVYIGDGSFPLLYKNVAGAAVLQSPNPATFYINRSILKARNYPGVVPNDPTASCGAGILQAMRDAHDQGKVLEFGPDNYTMGATGWPEQYIDENGVAQTRAPFINTKPMIVRGEGARLIAPGSNMNAFLFVNVQAPLDMRGMEFENWGTVAGMFTPNTNLGDEGDIILREIKAYSCNNLWMANGIENVRGRKFSIRDFEYYGNFYPSGAGQGQAVRHQQNGFQWYEARDGKVQHGNYQGIRLGGYPHDLYLNSHILLENLDVRSVISSGQTNSIQGFGTHIEAHNLYVEKNSNYTGTSSNTEAVYFAGRYVRAGNITIVDGGGQQGHLTIKSGQFEQAGPIRIISTLNRFQANAIRIDGDNVTLDRVIVEWRFSAHFAATGSESQYAGQMAPTEAVLVSGREYFFTVDTPNTATAATLNIDGLGAKALWWNNDDAAATAIVEPNTIVPGQVYRASYDQGNDRLIVDAVCYSDNSYIFEGNFPDGGNTAMVVTTGSGLTTVANGSLWWLRSNRSPTGTPTIKIDNAPAKPLKYWSGGILTSKTGGNDFEFLCRYSADDDCFIYIPSHHNPALLGRFLPILGGAPNAYTATVPRFAGYVDAVETFIVANAANTGASAIDINGLGPKPILNTSGGAISSGNLSVGRIYSLKYSAAYNGWVYVDIGNNQGIQCLINDNLGKLHIRNIEFINTQYNGLMSLTGSDVEITNLKGRGRYFGRSTFASLLAPSSSKPDARAVIRRVDMPFEFAALAGSGLNVAKDWDVVDMQDVDIRVLNGTSANNLVTGNTTASSVGSLKLRNIKATNFTGYVSYFNGFASIDSDYRFTFTINPPAVAANVSGMIGTVSVPGVKIGDHIKVHPVLGDTTDVQLFGKCLTDGVVTLYQRGGPAGGDIPSGAVAVSYERR